MIGSGLRFARYDVGARIGKGGFGVVHFARDVELRRDLAIKFLRHEYHCRPRVLHRFLQEARAAARIGHPGIVTVFECGLVSGTGTPADGTAFIAMELLRGESLARRLAARGRLAPEPAIAIARQLAAALASAHAAGIIHRDLKPDNVFLVPDPAVRGGERVKILDFGVAKLAEPGDDELGIRTGALVMLGTPRYMSPEQARSSADVDHRSDIYALGCILYEVLCGRPPYGGDPIAVLEKHQGSPVPSPRSVVGSTPHALDRLIAAMLAKAPEDRPPTMEHVDATLGACEREAVEGAARDPTEDRTTPYEARATSAEPADDPTLMERPIAPEVAVTEPLRASLSTHEITAPRLAPPVLPAPAALASLHLAPRAPRPVGAAADGSPRPRRHAAMLAGGVLALVGGVVVLAAASSGHEAAEVRAGAAAATALSELARPAPAAGSAAHAPPSVPAHAPPPTAAELESECLRAVGDARWADASACADRLAPASPAVARDIRTRAATEAAAAPHVAAAERALAGGDLRAARAALDRVSAEVGRRGALASAYQAAEQAAVRELVRQLRRASTRDCTEHERLLAAARAGQPPPIALEAARQVRCPAAPAAAAAARAACDEERLTQRGLEHYARGDLAAALAAYEQALACRPSEGTAMKAFVVSCNLRSIAKARLLWRRLAPTTRQSTVSVCLRNGISEEMLRQP